MKDRMVAACALLVCGALMSAHAGPGQFAPTTVEGVRIEAGATLLDEPALFSSDSLCSAVGQLRPLYEAITEDLVGELNALVARFDGDIQLVRYTLELSPDCSGYVDATRIHQGDLSVVLRLPGNRFVTNVTTPDVDLFGGTVGLPQGADPRIAIRFDVELRVALRVPLRRGEHFASVEGSAAVSRVSLPDGLNFTGELIDALADAASSVYDYFNDGRLGRLLGRGWRVREALPDSILAQLNQALDRIGPQLPDYRVAVGPPAGILTITATDGQVVVDNRCIDGYVWREAVAGDAVCVLPEVRAATRSDNRAVAQRRLAQPDFSRCRIVASGARPSCPADVERIACQSGFVWREATPTDYVCVSPDTRRQAREDNEQAHRRRVDYVAPLN